MPEVRAGDGKERRLKDSGCLNPRPGDIRDQVFLEDEFFDSRDIVQVKYEMLRRVRRDGIPVSNAAAAFGFSRTAFYQAQKAFEERGLLGLLPGRRGPRRAHKLSDEVVDFIQERMEKECVNAFGAAPLVEEHFGISVHPRSIQRALSRRREKKRKGGKREA